MAIDNKIIVNCSNSENGEILTQHSDLDMCSICKGTRSGEYLTYSTFGESCPLNNDIESIKTRLPKTKDGIYFIPQVDEVYLLNIDGHSENFTISKEKCNIEYIYLNFAFLKNAMKYIVDKVEYSKCVKKAKRWLNYLEQGYRYEDIVNIESMINKNNKREEQIKGGVSGYLSEFNKIPITRTKYPIFPR